MTLSLSLFQDFRQRDVSVLVKMMLLVLLECFSELHTVTKDRDKDKLHPHLVSHTVLVIMIVSLPILGSVCFQPDGPHRADDSLAP